MMMFYHQIYLHIMGIMTHIKQSSIWVPFSLLRGKDVSHSMLGISWWSYNRSSTNWSQMALSVVLRILVS